jgi:hypothetical protein
MSSRLKPSGSLLLLGFVFTSLAHAQIRSAAITGTVTDASGAVIPGAEVVVTNQATNIATKATTTEAGLYAAPYLPAGNYTVAVTATGFAPYRQVDVILATAQTVRVDVVLRVGAVEQSVEVTATAMQLQTDTSTVSGAVQTEMIDALPNITQNPLYYAALQPGVVPSNSSLNTSDLGSFGIGLVGRRQFSAIGVNGGRPFTNDIQLDGLPVMGGGYNETSVVPNTEGLREVRVISNNFTAEYGRGQSVLAMSTKSGTNDFHGQVTYMNRNEAFNANTMANNADGVAREAFKVHDFGGALGGHIIRDKLFFHTSYHHVRHDRGSTSLMTVPTPLERVGNFSRTFIRDEAGQPVPAALFDPFNVTQLGPDLFRRAPIPNAIIPNPHPGALKAYSYYPEPNRTPDDAFNTNNFQATVVQNVRRNNLNNRVDFIRGKHSLYASGGISWAEIKTPRPFGKSPFNGAPGSQSDHNPYFQLGDTIVLNPTTLVDVRYGLSRIHAKLVAGDKEGFTPELYDEFGVPRNLHPLMLFFGEAPNIHPNSAGDGQGGGSNWVNLTSGMFNSKNEGQLTHSGTGSVTMVRGRWTFKIGGEFRNLLSNYADPEQGSVNFPSEWHSVGRNFNFEYVTANGGVAGDTKTNLQKGINAARMLLGAGLYWIRPGMNVNPAFSQKYMAVYSQNDWRATSKLTLNLGLRWEVQPGPTERFDRMSSYDLEAMSPFGTQGTLAFVGVGGYSRNLWDTQYTNWGPRLGATYQLTGRMVIRGGFGITYLPTNSGYFPSPVDYGSVTFSSGVNQIPYGTDPQGIPVVKFSDPAPLAIAVGADVDNPAAWGIGECRFDRQYKNGRAMQWNLFVERRLADAWMVSAGYSASVSRNLMNRSFPIQSQQSLPASTLADWRQQWINSNGTLNPATQQVQNPWQPATGPLLPFKGPLASRTISRENTLYPYPLLVGSAAAIDRSDATADFHSMQLRVTRSFSRGLMMDAHYTWSKEIDNTDNMADNQGFNASGNVGNHDLYNFSNNRHLGLSDIPNRFVATVLYELPFGEGKPMDSQNRVFRAIASGWQTSGTFIAQSGTPVPISGATDGAVLGRPDRVSGAAIEVPQELQRWYDGKTSVTLPNGRVITPSKNTFLKYYSGAFQGRVVSTPNGQTVIDRFWWGSGAPVYNDIRTPGRFNIDMGLRRTIRIREGLDLEIGADAMNLLNHTQLNGAYSGGLGSTNVSTNAAKGLKPGMAGSDTFGTIGTRTFNPRQMMLRGIIRF